MTAYHAESDAIAGLVRELEAATQYANTVIAQAQAAADAVAADWTGPASQQYQAAHAEWVDGAQAMRSALADIHANAATAASNYTQLAATVHSIWN